MHSFVSLSFLPQKITESNRCRGIILSNRKTCFPLRRIRSSQPHGITAPRYHHHFPLHLSVPLRPCHPLTGTHFHIGSLSHHRYSHQSSNSQRVRRVPTLYYGNEKRPRRSDAKTSSRVSGKNQKPRHGGDVILKARYDPLTNSVYWKDGILKKILYSSS